MQRYIKNYHISRFIGALLVVGSALAGKAQVTAVTVTIPEKRFSIDPMIYGQMLENVNDSMIYGGVTDLKGNVREHLIPHLRDLQIPVMRWPGGTVVYEYHWQKGIGPRNKRPTVPTLAWNGIENYQFGTDEFLQWCRAVGTNPYINLNMSLHPGYKATIDDALAWMEYVNGNQSTPYGKLRAQNGHVAPYGVNYWCIGNENYLDSRAARVKETDVAYAGRLKQWATAIRKQYPDVKLLAIGRSIPWNRTVLNTSGQLVDFLTQHYYVNTRLQNGQIQNPNSTLFAPAMMEAHLALLGAQLDSANARLGRTDRPVRLSVDEWNNRHAVNDGGQFKFTRQSPRRQFDVAVVAGMLNAFVRQSPHVGMANYIFPVNAHGLIRTVGNDDAYHTTIYPVFKYYREVFVGSKLNVSVTGPSIATSAIHPNIEGDSHEAGFMVDSLTYIDAAAVLNEAGHIQLSLVNRSADAVHTVTVKAPDGYLAESVWMLDHVNIHATNSSDKRGEVKPAVRIVSNQSDHMTTTIPACGLHIIKFIRNK